MLEHEDDIPLRLNRQNMILTLQILVGITLIVGALLWALLVVYGTGMSDGQVTTSDYLPIAWGLIPFVLGLALIIFH